MMKRVVIYVRSSQDRHDVSCKAQEDQIKKVVKEKGEKVYRVFQDKALSSTRDVRPAFDEMIQLGTSNEAPFSKIYCLDTSRFGRDQHETQVILWELRRKHGIEVIFINMPQTGTYLDAAFESIMSAFDYIHSQQSKVKGIASMKQNIRNGYRAGGRAPYGYRLRPIEVGKNKDGDPIVKSKLEPNPETAPVASEYFERRALGETRMTILQDFYERGIPSPTGLEKWPVCTAKAMEDNIEVYRGHTVFFRHNERIKVRGKSHGYVGGVKWRPKEERVVNENTHEPLITEAVAARIREIKERGIRETRFNAPRIYPLSGVLRCSKCGTKYTGDRGIYRCNSTTKPGNKCGNNDISQRRIEQAVFSFLGQKVLNVKDVKALIEKVKKGLNRKPSEIPRIQQRLEQIEREEQRLIKLYRREIIDDDQLEGEFLTLGEQKKALRRRLEEMKAVEDYVEVHEKDILKAVKEFKHEVFHADPEIRKRAVQALLREIRIFPKKGDPWERIIEIKGASIPLTRLNMASPTGFEPVLPA